MDCLVLLRMIANCNTHDITMLRWIAFTIIINRELKHIVGKDNVAVDMLSQTRYKDDKEKIYVIHAHVAREELKFEEHLYCTHGTLIY